MHNVTSHGASIPALGFGTFELSPQEALRMVTFALTVGYRHIDTAQMYRNEAAVGEAIDHSDVARDEIFVTTKVWPDHFRDGDLQRSVEASLKRLRANRVDLLLLHWPNPQVPLKETLHALNEVKRNGMALHIGISNFTVKLIDQAVALSEAPLVCNQVEYHPYLNQAPVLDTLRRHGMALTAYCPIAKARVTGNPVLAGIGRRHGKTEIQVALRWLLQQQGVAAIPRSSKEAHARINFEVFDFELSATEMERIHSVACPGGRIVSPAGLAPVWDSEA